MLIREASLDEAPIVFQLMVEAFKQYDGQLHPPSGALRETVEDTLRIMKSSGGADLVWEEQQPVGSARYYFRDEYIYIGRVSVHPNHRSKGIGTKMMRFLEELAMKRQYFQARVEVRLSLPANVEFYKKLNYQVIDELHYPDRTDSWYVMNKFLGIDAGN